MSEPALQARARSVASGFSRELIGALIVVTERGTILSWSDGATVLFGYAPGEVIGRTIFDTIVPRDLIEPKRQWLATVRDSGATAHESARVRKDGQQIWVDVAVRVHREPDGDRFIVLNERDITRIKYQRDAQTLEARFRGVLDAAPDAFVFVDATGRIALVNSQAERLFGYARAELLGEFVETLVPSRFHAEHPDHRAGYFSEPSPRALGGGLELSARRKDGSEFPVEISLSPVSIDDAHLAIAAIRDVTVAKRTEKALRVVNQELESFTSSVAHDLRAPILQIDGFSRLVSDRLGGSGEPDLMRWVERIQASSEYMGRLVNDLLDLARVAQQDVHPHQVALHDVVREVIGDLQGATVGRSVEWKLSELPTFDCDRGLMRVVFANLLSNALKYTRTRERAVIEVGRTNHDGSATVYVRDNGVGFDMQFADKLFGVFQRLHRAREFEGTGVGLATVQRIVHKHGGLIWAVAKPDEGATFSFTLGQPVRSPSVAR